VYWTKINWINVFLKLFDASLDNTKINFYLIQGCSSGEIFVSLKRIEQACLILCTRVNPPNKYKNKNDYYYSFKTWLGIDPGQTPSYELDWLLTCVNIRIKVIIIIILKSDSRIDPGQGLGHGSGWLLTRVNKRIKMIIIIVLKADLGVNPRPCSSHKLGWSLTRVNLRIRMVIIIVFKLDKEVNPGQGPNHNRVDNWPGLT